MKSLLSMLTVTLSLIVVGFFIDFDEIEIRLILGTQVPQVWHPEPSMELEEAISKSPELKAAKEAWMEYLESQHRVQAPATCEHGQNAGHRARHLANLELK